MPELSEQELDISYCKAFLEEWLKSAPIPVKDSLKTLVDGVAFYRDKYTTVKDDYDILLERYTQLPGLSAGYLQLLQSQKVQIDVLLMEDQREFHKQE